MSTVLEPADVHSARQVALSKDLIQKILQRQLVKDAAQALTLQENPFTKGESMVLQGSSIAALEGETYPEALPILRPPSDLDLYLYEPNGETGRIIKKEQPFIERINAKMSQTERCASLIKKAAQSIGAHIWPRSKDENFTDNFETLGSQEFSLSKVFEPQEINQVLQSDATQALLRRIYNEPTGTFAIKPVREPSRISTSIHIMAYPGSLLPPRQLETSQTKAGKLPVMADDDLNCLSLKLARVLLPADILRKPHKNALMYKPSDLVDIGDILALRAAKGEPPANTDILRILTLIQLSGFERRHIKKASLLKLEPNPDNICAMQKDLQNDGIPVSIAQTKQLLELTHNLAQKIFPEATQEAPLPLTQDDKEFMQLIKGTLTVKGEDNIERPHPALSGCISDRGRVGTYSFARPHLALQRLGQDRPKEIEQLLQAYPDFMETAPRYWHARPVHGGMDEAEYLGVLLHKSLPDKVQQR